MPVAMMTRRGTAPVAVDTEYGLCVDCIDDETAVWAHQVDVALETADDEFAAFVADIETEDLEVAYPAVTWRMSPLGQLRHVCGSHAAMHDEAAADDDDSELLVLAEAIGVIS